MAELATNKKARFNYELLDTYEAGIELLGFEVRAVRSGFAHLDGAHVTIRGGEAYLLGATISPYQPSNTPKHYFPDRNRKLLLTKKEIIELGDIERTKRLTIVAVSMYNKGKRIKVAIATARGKKKFDKRETLKKRDAERDMQRTLTKYSE
ncbi:MAG: SsrA-binding protein [Candidatus Taylorbacteria bacterium RIFCSPHIGHO2_01_FULL_46_22b]|uniref:SsrA-binding protein n=1 Tax=Candidatus Taylorbacteria bacterium RIFCSPHIGHO2_01_FULL_46_22b TaxID=1802301 RepID=A0A1G2M553_9BACT|nr:MAG: SsrA-binding protein [Candidatus Taylorbacteria bacterium RIFCSPHIGHO2_01_FULL_46_22b]